MLCCKRRAGLLWRGRAREGTPPVSRPRADKGLLSSRFKQAPDFARYCNNRRRCLVARHGQGLGYDKALSGRGRHIGQREYVIVCALYFLGRSRNFGLSGSAGLERFPHPLELGMRQAVTNARGLRRCQNANRTRREHIDKDDHNRSGATSIGVYQNPMGRFRLSIGTADREKTESKNYRALNSPDENHFAGPGKLFTN